MKHTVLYMIISFTRIFQKHSFFILATYCFGSHTAPLEATVSHSLETASLFVSIVIGTLIILGFSFFLAIAGWSRFGHPTQIVPIKALFGDLFIFTSREERSFLKSEILRVSIWSLRRKEYIVCMN